MLKEPIIRHLYQFPNVPSHKWHSWKVDNEGSLILIGLVVRLYHRNRLMYCVMILLDARKKVIMMIPIKAHNNKRFM